MKVLMGYRIENRRLFIVFTPQQFFVRKNFIFFQIKKNKSKKTLKLTGKWYQALQ